jgi:hypothetical protein
MIKSRGYEDISTTKVRKIFPSKIQFSVVGGGLIRFTGQWKIPYARCLQHWVIYRYDNITLIPLVLQLGLRIGLIQRMGAN